MAYLSVAHFWKYQNADVWNKSKGHPPWFKHYVHRDRELDHLPPLARLLFYELLAAATRYSNVLEADLNWLWAETRLDVRLIREHLPVLQKGGWIKETATPRRSRNPSRGTRDKSRDLIEEDKEEDKEEPLAAEAPRVSRPTARKPDELWDALVAELDTSPATKSERGRWNRAVSELREAGATPAEVHERAKTYRHRWPGTTLTPTALSSNWGALARRTPASPPCEQCGVGGGEHAEDCPVARPFTDGDIERVAREVAVHR